MVTDERNDSTTEGTLVRVWIAGEELHSTARANWRAVLHTAATCIPISIMTKINATCISELTALKAKILWCTVTARLRDRWNSLKGAARRSRAERKMDKMDCSRIVVKSKLLARAGLNISFEWSSSRRRTKLAAIARLVMRTDGPLKYGMRKQHPILIWPNQLRWRKRVVASGVSARR